MQEATTRNFVVHKHQLDFAPGAQAVPCPKGSEIIHFEFQDSEDRRKVPTVWFVRPVKAQVEQVIDVQIVGTGHPFEDRALLPSSVPPRHYGTVLHGGFVWHLFLVGVRNLKEGIDHA